MKSDNIKQIFSGILFFVFAGVLSYVPLSFDLGGFAGQMDAQVYSATEPYYTFSHEDELMIAGKDFWVFKLDNAKRGDKLTVKAWKDGAPINGGGFLVICKVRFGDSCGLKGKPQKNDIGKWVEKVFINGVEKGTIEFTVKLPDVVAPPQSDISFTFSHNNGILVAERDTWTITVSGLNPGDTVYANAWKDGEDLKTLKICKVSTITSLFSSCSLSGKPSKDDVGVWEESLFVGRNVGGHFETISIGDRGIIKFEVKRAQTAPPPPPPVTIFYGCVNHQCVGLPQRDSRVHWFGPVGLKSCQTSCEDVVNFPPPPTYSFAGPVNGKTMIADKDSYTYTLSSAQPKDVLFVKAWRDGKYSGKYTICKVDINSYQCSKSAPVTRGDIGEWEGEVGYTRNGIDFVLGERGAVKFEVVQ